MFRNSRGFLRLFISIFALHVLCGAVAAQQSFTIDGRVTDPPSATGNPIPGVTVVLTLNGSTQVTTQTDSAGHFAFANVPAGSNYEVSPAKAGYSFNPVSQGGSNLGSDRTLFFTGAANANTVQFSSTAFFANEGATSATVTVVRSGDTSGTASVNYRTVDDPAQVRCDTINNTAYARCDYATTIDTLNFAAGEAIKTFTIPLIDDSFAEGDETFAIVLENPIGIILGAPSNATVTINDNETVNGPNPIFTTPFFVRQHYLDFLSREPDTPGFNAWTGVLNNCPDVNNDPSCDRITVSAAFFGSQEFQLKGYFVYRFYKLAFNRLPGYTELVSDMRAVTGQTQAEVFQKKAAFTNAFTLRTEFISTYNAMSNATYVSTLMGRYGLSQVTTPDPAAPDGTNKVTLTTNDLTNQLNLNALTRAQVLRAIADSDQVFGLEFNQAFVAMQYYGYLRRAPETDGYNAWLNYLNAHPNDSRTMVNGFMNSIEYRLRFGPSN